MLLHVRCCGLDTGCGHCCGCGRGGGCDCGLDELVCVRAVTMKVS